MKLLTVNISVSLIFILLQAGSVQAQGGSKNHALEELIVTAQKRIETQQDVAASFNVYSADNLEATGWSNVTDMADLIPSMEVIGVTKTRTTVFIRSIGTNKYDIGTEGSIGVFVDGVYIPRFSSLMQNLIDLERVEVLRGPQGTLYGRNTIGGAISLYSKPPAEQLKVTAEAGIANKDSFHVGGTVSGPLMENVLGYLAVTARETGGFRVAQPSSRIADFSTDTSDDEKLSAGRGKVHISLTEELSLGLTVEYSEQDVSAFTGEVIAPAGDVFAISPPDEPPFITPEEIAIAIAEENADFYKSTVNTAGFTEVQSVASSIHVEWAGEDLTIESIFGYRDEKVDELTDNDRMEYQVIEQISTQLSETFSEEFKISSESGGLYSFDDKVDWLVGVFLYNDKAERDDIVSLGQDSVFFGTIAGLDAVIPGFLSSFPPPYFLDFLVELETRSWAVFTQGTYYFNDEWSLTLGARFSKDTKEFSYTESTPGLEGLIPKDNFSFDDRLEFESTDPKVSMEYEPEWADDLMVYLSYAQGYKSGGIQFVARREEIARDSFGKEILLAWEAGLKSRWFDQSLQINGAIYNYDYQDQQIQAIAVVPVGDEDVTTVITDNAGNSTLNGIEVEVQYRWTEFVTVQGSVSYLDASFDDYVRRDGLDLSGFTLPAAPEWSYWLSADYEMPLKSEWILGARIDYSWRDDQVFTPDGLYQEDDYALINLAYWMLDPSESWKFRLYCKNCEDIDYRTSVTPLTDGSAWAGTGDGRRYGLDVTYYFQ